MKQNVILVAGVSGSGKSTIGKLLADRLGLPFKDADDYHPQANVDKMAAGHPLNDADRKPWLETLALEMEKWSKGSGAVLACSALKESYRELLSQKVTPQWVFLDGSFELLKSRLDNRKGHFFNSELLQSQLDTLEEPDYGIHVSIEPSPEAIVDEILKKL
ncbi:MULTISPECIES: gluconokinase [unclassified Leeuwenhoekiella]|uniref:gluconokinase n=1 Tax=unclassified Leeuwenhoekiella TaxID=2615029 RepID=UPI000C670C8A|nr:MULTISPECIES: gluconokinase [unclassified Leeuwenhoekiella]MAW93851.1 gluconate kinase [Leeuwenhoekiella sp.]MBA82258.1 gluconate kinase [Leeuwenhoekiella sp.]|tara:strand:+ start:2271 stop:2753 length:483 start_codon:yes stop_codon:yes gene_type:complete